MWDRARPTRSPLVGALSALLPAVSFDVGASLRAALSGGAAGIEVAAYLLATFAPIRGLESIVDAVEVAGTEIQRVSGCALATAYRARGDLARALGGRIVSPDDLRDRGAQLRALGPDQVRRGDAILLPRGVLAVVRAEVLRHIAGGWRAPSAARPIAAEPEWVTLDVLRDPSCSPRGGRIRCPSGTHADRHPSAATWLDSGSTTSGTWTCFACRASGRIRLSDDTWEARPRLRDALKDSRISRPEPHASRGLVTVLGEGVPRGVAGPMPRLADGWAWGRIVSTRTRDGSGRSSGSGTSDLARCLGWWDARSGSERSIEAFGVLAGMAGEIPERAIEDAFVSVNRQRGSAWGERTMRGRTVRVPTAWTDAEVRRCVLDVDGTTLPAGSVVEALGRAVRRWSTWAAADPSGLGSGEAIGVSTGPDGVHVVVTLREVLDPRRAWGWPPLREWLRRAGAALLGFLAAEGFWGGAIDERVWRPGAQTRRPGARIVRANDGRAREQSAWLVRSTGPIG